LYTGPVYCKSGFNGIENSGQDYQICRKTSDAEGLDDRFEPDPQTGETRTCTCERLVVKDYTKKPFELRGGSDCKDGYCFVSYEKSTCTDKEYDHFSWNLVNFWFAKKEHAVRSKEACEPQNRVQELDRGNEELIPSKKINAAIMQTVEVEDYEDCLNACRDRPGECGAWSYEAGKCYLHDVDTCCNQRSKLNSSNTFISGFYCPVCWATQDECKDEHCTHKERSNKNVQQVADGSQSTTGSASGRVGSVNRRRRRPKLKFKFVRGRWRACRRC